MSEEKETKKTSSWLGKTILVVVCFGIGVCGTLGTLTQDQVESATIDVYVNTATTEYIDAQVKDLLVYIKNIDLSIFSAKSVDVVDLIKKQEFSKAYDIVNNTLNKDIPETTRSSLNVFKSKIQNINGVVSLMKNKNSAALREMFPAAVEDAKNYLSRK